VFDPLAVLLLIAANQTYRKSIKDKKQKVKVRKSIDVPPVTSVESFIDDKHQVIRKDNIAEMENK
jgi:hypothetical protein